MKIAKAAAAVSAALFLVAGCSSGSVLAGSASAPSTTSRPTPTHAADPNVAACSAIDDEFLRIRATFDSWHPARRLFDQRVANAVRDEATKLFGYERRATGAVARAVHAEAAALVDLSMAIESYDEIGAGDAATRVSRYLAQVRGVCNF